MIGTRFLYMKNGNKQKIGKLWRARYEDRTVF